MKRKTIVKLSAAIVTVLLLIGWGLLLQRDVDQQAVPADDGNAAVNNNNGAGGASGGSPVEAALPVEAAFVKAAESERFVLWADAVTAHFKIESKETGKVWRSYPNPEYWELEKTTGTWKSSFLSPVMLEYIDASNSKSQSKLTNWMEEKGVLENYELTGDGFKATFYFPGTKFTIPVEVALIGDHVETKVFDEGIAEGNLSLLNLKLYPLFGAEPSHGQEGYMLVPDGSGALIKFNENRSNDKSIYRENVYGADLSFYNEQTGRQEVKMPIFGLKSGDQSFLAVMTDGEEYAKLFAAPAGALGISNWITPEWQYRIKFFQSTNKQGDQGFYTYSKDRFVAGERTTRYYPIDGPKADYAAMAERYRSYLIEENGLARLEQAKENIPLYVDIIGADLKQGLLWDDYIEGTTTKQAETMVKELSEAGIANLSVLYAGWQRWGYSSYGGLFPVDKRLGGNSGMKAFIDAAHKLDVSVFLSANYSLNSSGRGGFWKLNDGLRNLAGTLQEQYGGRNNDDKVTLTSPLYGIREAEGDLAAYKSLGADGLLLEGGIGRALNTDFNNRHKASRSEVLEGQQRLLEKADQELGSIGVANGSFYSLANVDHIHRIADDYSYDIFVDEAIPFEQIVLHGLVTYSSDWANLSDEYNADFLRSVEYGAYPSYVFTAADSGKFKRAYTIWYYSMSYRDWKQSAAEQYKRLNEALGDVQDQYIVGHRTLAEGVKETIYENGKTIIVNYNEKPYSIASGSVTVPALDFIVTTGGGA
ncbi:DUF5696 domain-containing protein [Paenibacillus sp. YIM B09110]|uniref:DUF5696 domain-containing protein n=1 Tax=Paenibacillus sp. YIM B09110 TaxID=3126102 RepID=UPI00301DEC43